MLGEENQTSLKAEAVLLDVLKCIVTTSSESGSTLKIDCSNDNHNSNDMVSSRSTEKLLTEDTSEQEVQEQGYSCLL
jgi:hypothetical protein